MPKNLTNSSEDEKKLKMEAFVSTPEKLAIKTVKHSSSKVTKNSLKELAHNEANVDFDSANF